MLDFPDDVSFPATPVHAAASQTFLVTNLGAARALFELQARAPFAVRPAAGELAPGEVLRCCADFRPASAGAQQVLTCSAMRTSDRHHQLLEDRLNTVAVHRRSLRRGAHCVWERGGGARAPAGGRRRAGCGPRRACTAAAAHLHAPALHGLLQARPRL